MSAVLLACEVFVFDMVNRWVMNSPNAAAVLDAHRSGVGDRVAMLVARSIEWVTVMPGVMPASCAYVPLSPANPASNPCTSP